MFKGPHPNIPKAEHKAARDLVQSSRSYEDVIDLVGGEEGWAKGAADFDEIRQVLVERERLRFEAAPTTAFEAAVENTSEEERAVTEADAAIRERVEAALGAPPDIHDLAAKEGVADPATPEARPNPEAPTSRAPLLPSNTTRTVLPASVLGQDHATPTPGGGVELPATL
jgi:hypothetical protein